MKLGMLSWSGINMSWYKFCSIWGRFGYMPLTTSMSVFGRERPTFGDETISIASYCFQVFFSCQHRTTGVLCQFLWFWGFVWTFLCIKWVFNAFMCIIQIWIACTCSGAYKLVEKSNMSLGAILGPMQEIRMNFKHQGTVDCRPNVEMPGF